MAPEIDSYFASLWPYQLIQRRLQQRDVRLDLERATTPGAYRDFITRLVRKIGRSTRMRIARLAEHDRAVAPYMSIVQNWFCRMDRRVGGRRAHKVAPVGVQMMHDHRLCAAVLIHFTNAASLRLAQRGEKLK